MLLFISSNYFPLWFQSTFLIFPCLFFSLLLFLTLFSRFFIDFPYALCLLFLICRPLSFFPSVLSLFFFLSVVLCFFLVYSHEMLPLILVNFKRIPTWNFVVPFSNKCPRSTNLWLEYSLFVVYSFLSIFPSSRANLESLRKFIILLLSSITHERQK